MRICKPSLATLVILSCGASQALAAASPVRLEAQVVRTRYGIPHVVAKDWAGLGFGTAYAFAEDNVCLLADHMVTLSGERSKYFGPDGIVSVAFRDTRNVDSDTYFRGFVDDAALRRAVRSASPEYRALLRGYVAGYNHFLRRTGPSRLPLACRDAAWVRPMREADALRLNEDKMRLTSGERFLPAMVSAAPPPPGAASMTPGAGPIGGVEAQLDRPQFDFGSNGWAFGADTTGGPGVLLGNPHYPWNTTNRFWQVHQTIPGQLDVMGVTLSGLPSVVIGFNRNVAWTHTVSTDRHFTYFELALDPGDPTAYFVDGRRIQMERRTVTIDVKGQNPVKRTLYRTIYGPVIVVPSLGLGWTREHAYAVKDADEANFRAPDAWIGIERADSVAAVRRAISEPVGIPWVNTIATDRHGDVLYADITPTPNVTAVLLESCSAKDVNATLRSIRFYVLDGARSACDWPNDARSRVPGLLPAALMPQVIRRDFVANSNDSFWLSNDSAPIRDVPEIVGRVDEAQGLRTRDGLMTIRDTISKVREAGAWIAPSTIKDMILGNHNLSADLALPDVLSICAKSADAVTSAGEAIALAPACEVLSRWDRRADLGSRGAALWMEFWSFLSGGGAGYPSPAVPFDALDPLHTPRGLKQDDAGATKVRTALADAIALLRTRGIALDARWGDVQNAVRGERRIPIHGGPGTNGILNVQESEWAVGIGYLPVHGSSYMQVVTFDAAGPVADALLSYSQSTDPASAHFADQTELYSGKGWNRLPFLAQDVAAQQVSVEHLRQ